MTKEALYQTFKEQGERISKLSYSLGDNAKLFIDNGDGIYTLKDNVDFNEVKESDIILTEYRALPLGDKELKAMIISRTPSLQYCLKKEIGFAAILDDMAQIFGSVLKLVKEREDKIFVSEIIKAATKKVAGVMVVTGYDEDAEDYRRADAVGLTITGGRNLDEAVTCLTVLEKTAHVGINAQKISSPKMVNKVHAKLIHFVYLKKYSKGKMEGFKHNSKEGIPDWEMEAREDMLKYCKKLVEQGLVQGTWGNISMRLDADYMIVTPSGLDYFELLPEDMVKVKINNLEYEGHLKPSAEKGMHAEIYKRRSDVHAIVHTHSLYCSAFSAAHSYMPIKTAQDKHYLGDLIKLAPYGLSGTKLLSRLVAEACDDNFGALLSNHGMVAIGDSIENAYANALRMEANAKTLFDDYDKKVAAKQKKDK